jgi:hypothetical protein
MPRQRGPKFTGFDYLLGAAEAQRGKLPFADDLADMLMTSARPNIFPELGPTLETEVAAKRDLTDAEETALSIFNAAVAVARRQRDEEATRELLAAGVAMLQRFPGYLEVIAPDVPE